MGESTNANKPSKIVLICGISYPWPSDGKISLFSRFIGTAVGFIREHKDEIAAVVVSGGVPNTGAKFRNASEASRLAEFLGYMGVTARHPVHIDEVGVTTNDHLNAAEQVMTEYGLSGDSLVIFCDEARCGKMEALARFKFGYKPQVIAFPVHSGRVAIAVNNVAAELTILAEIFPSFHTVLRGAKRFFAEAV